MREFQTYKHQGVTLVDLRTSEQRRAASSTTKKEAKKQALLLCRDALPEDTSYLLNHSPSGSPIALAAYGAMT
ncbi:MAG: hypothetical protein JJ979_19950 [Roseibium sp.]|nr:hypothetical protein [Roseibium sp.]